jgi:hypothetical protein
MRVSIPDDLYDQLKSLYHSASATEAALVRYVESLVCLPKGRTLTLDAAQLTELEAILGFGSVLDAPDLVAKVQHLAAFRVGPVTIAFDASDLSRLQQRASRRDLTIEAYVRLMLDRFKEEWMMIGEPVELEAAR